MQPVLFDTSVYISALRGRNGSILTTRNVGHGSPLWLSAVVLEELYAGADAKVRKALVRLERTFVNVGRLLVPDASDWSRTGNILGRIGEKYGYERIRKSRVTNDALIATSAARNGIVLITVNVRDFGIIAEYCSLDYRTL